MPSSSKRLRFVQVDIARADTRAHSKHRKARTGCKQCKLRKVKCDERLPKCGACEKRDRACIRAPPSNDEALTTTTTSARSEERVSYPSPECLDLNAIKLFYDFQQRTADTLCLGGKLWQDLIPLSFKEHHFMHAILSLTAAHLQAIGEDDGSLLNEIALHHQVEAIRGLREATEEETTARQNQDAMISTAILLYHYTWAILDQDSETPSSRSLLPVDAMPYRQVILGNVFSGPSIWQPTMIYSPKMALQAFSVHTTLPSELQTFFDSQFQLICPEESTNTHRYEIFAAQYQRLIPVVAVILLRAREPMAINSDWIIPSIVRYLTTWPLISSGAFLETEQQKDPLAYVILWQYFTAIDKCGAPSMWWTQRRTAFALGRARSELQALDVEVPNVFDVFERRIGGV